MPTFAIQSKEMLLCYITDRRSFAGGDAQQSTALLRRIAEAAGAGVDLIQLREKDLTPRALEQLAREAVGAVREHSGTTKLLVNTRSDVALACGADGVHLPAGELPASEVRALWMRASTRPSIIGVSAHTAEEVHSAAAHGADFAVLAPIFEKVQANATGIGLAALRSACGGAWSPDKTDAVPASRLLVLALGGVNLSNAGECLSVGASGVAGIRLFQEGDIADTVRLLREMRPLPATLQRA